MSRPKCLSRARCIMVDLCNQSTFLTAELSRRLGVDRTHLVAMLRESVREVAKGSGLNTFQDEFATKLRVQIRPPPLNPQLEGVADIRRPWTTAGVCGAG